MNSAVIINRIKEKLSDISNEPNVLVVLKGIPLSVVDESVDNVRLDQVIENKLGYFMSLYNKRHYITYEEFVLLSDFIVSQYQEIYILNNNIYMEQYPVEECFPSKVRKGLLAHFEESEEDENDETYIGNIDEYISIFEGIREYNGYLLGAYCQPTALSSNKIIEVNLFDIREDPLNYTPYEESVECDLIEEADYIDFIKRLFNGPDELHVRISNYTGDINRLKSHIQTVAYYWQEYTDVFFVQSKEAEETCESKAEFTELLKQYWGHDTFRDLSVYNLQKLERGTKEVISVSQENIIANLVQQVENCGEDKDFQDMFVTAPTGAGKSVMFQIPAIYLAEKYSLLTIVISPLIGLMNDQVKGLELKNYKYAKTINSDISPIIKQDIIEKVADGQYHILYISPETLLSRSDVEQLIGNRTIGMIVIDEAHIVTTWGKQFRPDYWYLGDHIRKLRKKQINTKQRSFVIATFTATAIYHGLEDMYTETINSLHMLNPITYLGYVKRNDIDIVIDRTKKQKGERKEYEPDKFYQIESIIRRAIITNKKTLIYFPTVALIQRCYEFLRSKREVERVTVYYGTLNKDKKQENYEEFYNKQKLVMLATKAFGMGIDIEDIELVVHFAPTGNVCDYVQEIGRAARKKDIKGEAFYHYDSRDFKHINRLHGLSTIQPYQLIKVMEKIDELYQQIIRERQRESYTKKRNTMLLDAENFSYIFGSPINDEDDNISKVKTSLLLIQKDFESKMGFSPITVRPIPMFSMGFFEIKPAVQNRLNRRYHGVVEEINEDKHICRVLLSSIWSKDYKTLSFPKFKYLLYTNDKELEIVTEYPMTPALIVNIVFDTEFNSVFQNIWSAFRRFVMKKVQLSEYVAVDEIVDAIAKTCKINKYRARTIVEVVIASMDTYRKNFSRITAPIAKERGMANGVVKYQFNVAVNSYFSWLDKGVQTVQKETVDGKLYLVNDNGNRIKEMSVVLGVLEAIGCLSFEMLGGANSQLYIYVNQIQTLKNILNAPYTYNNRLLDAVGERHLISVKMLTYIYENDFTSEETWDILEDYFLGKIPEKVKHDCKRMRPEIVFD